MLQPQEKKKLILENISFYHVKSTIEICNNTWHAVFFSSSHRYATNCKSYFKKQNHFMEKVFVFILRSDPYIWLLLLMCIKWFVPSTNRTNYYMKQQYYFKSLRHSVLPPGVTIREQNTHFFIERTDKHNCWTSGKNHLAFSGLI